MYTITFENQTHNQWTSKYIFESYHDARTYLISYGFHPKGGMFTRGQYNWSSFTKAYVTPREVWKR